MKRESIIFLFLLFLFVSCKSKDQDKPASEETVSGPLNAARNFLRASLDGKFDEAEKYMLSDSNNLNRLDVARRGYERSSPDDQRSYRGANIRILDGSRKVNDSVHIVVFSNTYKNQPDTLKVLKINGEWLVDFKYLYEHDKDTVQQSSPKDTLR